METEDEKRGGGSGRYTKGLGNIVLSKFCDYRMCHNYNYSLNVNISFSLPVKNYQKIHCFFYRPNGLTGQSFPIIPKYLYLIIT